MEPTPFSPVPTKNGCTHSRSSSSSPAASRACASGPKPYCTMSAPGCSLSSRTASTGSRSMNVVLFHSDSVRVVETTYLGSEFIRSLIGSPAMDVHTGAKLS